MSELPEFATPACAGFTELFYSPEHEKKPQKERRETAAKALCARCPHKNECLEWAMNHRESGIWGGLTDEERVMRGAKVLDYNRASTSRVRAALRASKSA